MNKITNNKPPLPEKSSNQKIWKSGGFKFPPSQKQNPPEKSVQASKIQPTLKEKKFSLFFDQIHKVDEMAEELRQSEVIEVEDFSDNPNLSKTPINSLLNSQTSIDGSCHCMKKFEKLNQQLDRFKHFYEDIQKKGRAINTLLQALAFSQKQPEAIQQLFLKLCKEINDSTSQTRQQELEEENMLMKKKINELEKTMMKIIEKNIQLQTKMEYCEDQLSELQTSFSQSDQMKGSNLNSTKIPSQYECRRDRLKSNSIESQQTKKDNHNLTIRTAIISPKSSATKRFVRTNSKNHHNHNNSDMILNKEPRNQLKIDKRKYMKEMELKNTSDA